MYFKTWLESNKFDLSDSDSEAKYNDLKEDILNGIVYHGTTLEQAKNIQKTGIQGFHAGNIIKDVAAKYNVTLTNKQKASIGRLVDSYKNDNSYVSTTPSPYVAARWAGSGGEFARQIEAIITKSPNMQSKATESKITGEPAILICKIKNFLITPSGNRAKRYIAYLDESLAKGDINYQDARKFILSNYTNYAVRPEQLEILGVLRGSLFKT